MKNTFSCFARAIYHYLLFFLLASVLISITVSLFVCAFSEDVGIVLTEENLNRAAKLAFLCVVLLSFVMTLIDFFRRKLTTEKITKRIADAAKEVVKGNFSVRIANVSNSVTDGNYNEIIDCFNKMAEELGSLETMRADFTADISHEMKTPLAVMQNYATLLQEKRLSEENRIEYAKAIGECSRKTADMMTNILKLNRLENKQIYPKNEKFDLGTQITECLLMYENTWEKENIEIECDIEENVTVQSDSELLSIVWNNLFSNAFKFTPSQGKVSVTLHSRNDYAVVKVKDTGCGMTSDVGKRIFEKFFQGDTSRATSGNGLGLALVKRVIDILKGDITVESTVGVGTEFTVIIRRNYK